MNEKHELVGWDKAWGAFAEVLGDVHKSYPEWLALTRYLVGVVATAHPSELGLAPPDGQVSSLKSAESQEGVLFIPMFDRDYCLGVCYRLAKTFKKSAPDKAAHFIIPHGKLSEPIANDPDVFWHSKEVLRKPHCDLGLCLRGVISYFSACCALVSNKKTRRAMTVDFGFWPFHLAKFVGIYYWQIAAAKRFLRKNKIKVVVAINDVVKPAAPFISAARQLGVETVVLQHGAPGPQSAPFIAKYGWIWGETSRDLLCDFGATSDSLEIIGNLEIDNCKYTSEMPGEVGYVLLLLSQWRASTGWGEPEFQQFFSNVASAAKVSKHPWRLKIRLHPNEDEQVMQGIIKLITPFEVPYEFSMGETSVEEDIANSDFACTVSSSSIMHAVAALKPCALLISAALEQRLGSPLLHKKQIARNTSDLVGLLNKVQPLKIKEREIIIANFGVANEKATGKLLALMRD